MTARPSGRSLALAVTAMVLAACVPVAGGDPSVPGGVVPRPGSAAPRSTAPSAGVPSAPTPSPDVPDGTFFSPEEVMVWRERALHGPYRSAGDVSRHSPGDWERIVASAESFIEQPDDALWDGPDGEDCVEADDEPPPPELQDGLRDAAFVYLVTADAAFGEAAARGLVAQARIPELRFSDEQRWCPEVVYDGDLSFKLSAWLTKLLFAYDFLGDEAFTRAEHAMLDEWFDDAATWFLHDAAVKLDENFVDRTVGDYRLRDDRRAQPGYEAHGFFGSSEIGAIARYYNNRRMTSLTFVGLVGIEQRNQSFMASAQRFVREWLAYSMYPDGWFGEFERWDEDLPDQGWAYSTYNVGLAAVLADAFARHGDFSLYEYTTSSGAHGTAGGEKSLHEAILALGRYLDGTYERYATDEEDEVGDTAARIDGRHEPDDWHSVHDVGVALANRYYDDDDIRGMYTRTGPGMPPYPAEAASFGGFTPWGGVWGIHPGVLFQYGGMEDYGPY